MKMKEKIHTILEEIKTQLQPYKQIIFQFAITALSALVIGAVFGVFFLQLSHEDEMSIQSKATQVDSDKSSRTLPGLSFYLVQAGLFSERKNAEEIQAQFIADKASAVIWQDEAGYYVFTALANSEAKIREKNSNDKKFFIKEWTIAEKKLSLSQEEAGFFEDLHKSLEAALAGLDEQAVDLAPWQKLRQAAVETDKTKTFLVFMDKSLANEAETVASFDMFLLEILYLYENLKKD